MTTKPTTWWPAAGTLLCGGATLLGLIGVFAELPGRVWWLGLWWGGIVLAAWFARRWELARKAVPRDAD